MMKRQRPTEGKVITMERIGMVNQDLRNQQRMGSNGIRGNWATFESPERSNNE